MSQSKTGKISLSEFARHTASFAKKLLTGDFEQMILTHKEKAVLGLVTFKWLKDTKFELEDNQNTIHELRNMVSDLEEEVKRVSDMKSLPTDKEITPAQEKLLELREKFSFLEDLNDGDVIEITKNVELIHLEDNQVIFEQGFSGRQVYYILSGSVQIILQMQERTIPLAHLETESIFGEMAPITQEPRSATALAQGKTELLSFEIDDDRVMQSPLQFALLYRNFIKILSSKLILANTKKA